MASFSLSESDFIVVMLANILQVAAVRHRLLANVLQSLIRRRNFVIFGENDGVVCEMN